MDNQIQDGVSIIDNVTVLLTDIHTGAKRSFSSHNKPLNHALSAYSQWDAGVNNTGQNAVLPATVISLGSGSGSPANGDSGLFSPIPGATATLSYAQPNTPTSGTTTKVWQIPAGSVTVQVTEAWMADAFGNGFYHTMFGTPFTPSATETITIQWTSTFSG